jgi:transposase
MLSLPTSLRVLSETGPTDMRRRFKGLVGIVERELNPQVESGDLFLFFNRRGDRVKVLWFTGVGLVIWYRRLESGTFEVPQAARAVQDDGSSNAGIQPTTARKTGDLLTVTALPVSHATLAFRRRHAW